MSRPVPRDVGDVVRVGERLRERRDEAAHRRAQHDGIAMHARRGARRDTPRAARRAASRDAGSSATTVRALHRSGAP